MMKNNKLLWTILTMVLVVALVHPVTAEIVQTTVLYIPGNATVPSDISPSAQTITVGGLASDCSLSSTCVPKFGSGAIKLNGTTDYLNTTVSSMNLGNGSWYAGLWFNDTAVAPVGNTTYLIIEANATGGDYGAFAIGRRDNKTQYMMSYSGTGWNTIATGTNDLKTSIWNYVACNHTASLGTTCYLNGTADATIGVTPPLYNKTTARTYVGAKPFGGTVRNFTTGTIDDVVVVNGAAFIPSIIPPWEYTHPLKPAFALNHTMISDYADSSKNLINVTSNVYDVSTATWYWTYGDPLQPTVTSTAPLPPGIQYTSEGIYTITELVSNGYTTATNTSWVLAVN